MKAILTISLAPDFSPVEKSGTAMNRFNGLPRVKAVETALIFCGRRTPG